MKPTNATLFEYLVGEHFSQATGELVHVMVGNCQGYDGRTESYALTFECKLDLRAQDTHNLCFEVAHNKTPSGLSVCTAMLWVSGVPKNKYEVDCFQFRVPVLKKKLAGWQWFDFADKETGKPKSAVLVPTKKAQEFCEERFTVSFDWGALKPWTN
ncbi:MAG: hypothetical protein WBH56_08780 [Bacteroidota bacterium]